MQSILKNSFLINIFPWKSKWYPEFIWWMEFMMHIRIFQTYEFGNEPLVSEMVQLNMHCFSNGIKYHSVAGISCKYFVKFSNEIHGNHFCYHSLTQHEHHWCCIRSAFLCCSSSIRPFENWSKYYLFKPDTDRVLYWF